MINAVVIIVLLLLAAYLILSEQKLPEIIEAMRQAKPEYLLVGIALLILYESSRSTCSAIRRITARSAPSQSRWG